jgi:hypothetical protein
VSLGCLGHLIAGHSGVVSPSPSWPLGMSRAHVEVSHAWVTMSDFDLGTCIPRQCALVRASPTLTPNPLHHPQDSP